MRARSAALALALASLAGGVPPAAAADEPLALTADAEETGWIAFHLRGRSGTTAVVSEQVGSRSTPVASIPLGSGAASSRRAVRWRCDRSARRFVATAPGPFGTQESSSAEVQTPSCRRRLRASVRRRVPAGGRAFVRLRDRWGVGGTRVSLCSRPPAGGRSCRKVGIPAGRRSTAVPVRASRPGRWIIEARVAGGRVLRRTLSVRPRGGRLRVLATGDSMIQILDGFLKQRIHGRVRSDARVSTGISKPGMFDWVRHARRQAGRRRPDVTVMFIGANDGFPIGGAACCGRGWVKRYARRVRRMMETYRRGREGVVYWLTLPAPRDSRFARVFGPVNRALRRAAASFGQQVRLIDLRRVFSPDGRFHRVIRYRGRRVVARQGDGVHLSAAGASIAAELVIRALRRDRIL